MVRGARLGLGLIASIAWTLAACEGAPETHVAIARPHSVLIDTHDTRIDSLAQVCMIRPERLAREQSMSVRDNGRLVGATRGATYVCWLAAPGEHQITSIDDDTGPTLLEAREGQHYFIHQEVSALEGVVHAHLDFVNDEMANPMLDACDERVRVSVPGHEDEPDAMAIAPAASSHSRHARAR